MITLMHMIKWAFKTVTMAWLYISVKFWFYSLIFKVKYIGIFFFRRPVLSPTRRTPRPPTTTTTPARRRRTTGRTSILMTSKQTNTLEASSSSSSSPVAENILRIALRSLGLHRPFWVFFARNCTTPPSAPQHYLTLVER